MDSGRWAPAVPIKGYRWNLLNSSTATLHSTYTSSTTCLINAPTGNTFVNTRGIFGVNGAQQFGKLGWVILGPTAHTSNPGAVEVIEVLAGTTATSPRSVTLLKAPTLSFTPTTDPITLIGAGTFPGGWACLNQEGHSLLATVDECYSADPFTLVWKTTASGANPRILYTKLPVMNIQKYLTLSIMVKNLDSPTIGTGLVFSVADSTALTTPLTGLSITLDSSATGVWHEYTATAEIPNHADPQSLSIVMTGGGGTDVTTRLCIAGIAVSTTDQYDSLDQTSYTAGTPYTFSSIPNFSSVDVKRKIEGGKITNDFYRRPYLNTVMNQYYLPVPRYSVTYGLSEITDTEWTHLRRLLDWQQHGGLINHFPHTDLVGLPYYMTGKITIEGDRKRRLTDLTKQAFKMTFTEVSI